MVAAALRAAHGWAEAAIEIVPITTSGDAIQDRPLAEVGGKALWTKELDRCLLDGRTDFSVHSMKDVETIRPDALAIAAMLPRGRRARPADRRRQHRRACPRAPGSAPRRRAAPRNCCARGRTSHCSPIRGNVETRLAKLERGEADATLLAAAGLDRLGHGDSARRSTCCRRRRRARSGSRSSPARDDLRALLARDRPCGDP